MSFGFETTRRTTTLKNLLVENPKAQTK